jgi:hypothetical protein
VQSLETQLQKILTKQIDKIKKGELFSEEEINEIKEMFESLGKQIKDEKIRDVLSKAVDFLGTIKEDRLLSEEEKVLINKIISKKQKMVSSYFAATPRRGRSRSRSRAGDVAKQNEEIVNECPICRFEYNTGERTPQTLECHPTHKLCKTCVGLITEPTGQIKCPMCRQRSKSPAASARGLPAAASARGPPPSRHSTDSVWINYALEAPNLLEANRRWNEYLARQRVIREAEEDAQRALNRDAIYGLLGTIFTIIMVVGAYSPPQYAVLNMGKTIVGMFVLFIIGVCLKK